MKFGEKKITLVAELRGCVTTKCPALIFEGFLGELSWDFSVK